ncbi:hypothetical protein AK830_g5577 [Neonectria ditissima]|uniref:SET domain-containing protein n=1 Tax=Neonectria ditissima TaxID=78410 RepID=A0A0P7BIN4_9HYPO|nr:hypothetical protein AK830_g5577 [Neonectria ditissima]
MTTPARTMASGSSPTLQSGIQTSAPSQRQSASSSTLDGSNVARPSDPDAGSKIGSVAGTNTDKSSVDKGVQGTLPQNWDAIYIRPSQTCKGYGVFATRALPPRYPIIIETPRISCIHWSQRGGTRTIGDEWEKLDPQARATLCHYFRTLKDLPAAAEPGSKNRKLLEKFVEEYAFWDTTRANCHIYDIASHINHACPSCANAEQYTEHNEPNKITVTLARGVREGEELFINYNKRRLRFGCGGCGSRRQRARIERENDKPSR